MELSMKLGKKKQFKQVKGVSLIDLCTSVVLTMLKSPTSLQEARGQRDEQTVVSSDPHQ